MKVNLTMVNPSILRRLKTMCFTYYQPHASIVVYDITQRRSFEQAKELVDECAQQASPGVFVALVGNKTDLESTREVSFKVSNAAMFI